jgi:hypothetical protein
LRLITREASGRPLREVFPLRRRQRIAHVARSNDGTLAERVKVGNANCGGAASPI